MENTDKGKWRNVSIYLIGLLATLAAIGLLGFVMSRYVLSGQQKKDMLESVVFEQPFEILG